MFSRPEVAVALLTTVVALAVLSFLQNSHSPKCLLRFDGSSTLLQGSCADLNPKVVEALAKSLAGLRFR